MWKSPGVDVTATAPRIRQIEQEQRRAEAKPSVSLTVNCTAAQWHAPSRVTDSGELASIKRRPFAAHPSPLRVLAWPLRRQDRRPAPCRGGLRRLALPKSRPP